MSATCDIEALAAHVRAGRRAAIGRAVTLIENARLDRREDARALLDLLRPHAGGAVRLGVSGPPGVGKSTAIEALGLHLIALGKRVAVLAVDPSSKRHGGAILGDKTRMGRLAQESDAFIRPSPSGGGLGGAARATREAITVMEAAGFDVVIVESVGVGQSETAVADMTDCFVLLAQPASGDDLQGVKKGVLELADIIAVNKADGETADAARRAKRDVEAALSLLIPAAPWWRPPVLAFSALEGRGVTELWRAVEDHQTAAREASAFHARRRDQAAASMDALILEGLEAALKADRDAQRLRSELREQVRSGAIEPSDAAARTLDVFFAKRA